MAATAGKREIIITLVVIMMAMMLSPAATTTTTTVHQEKMMKSRCMRECYMDCSDIGIFSKGECTRECLHSCGVVLPNSSNNFFHDRDHGLYDGDREDPGTASKFVPYWI